MELHGADIYTASEKSGIDKDSILDFSSNINPLGIPESVKNAAINSINYSNKYPDIYSRELVLNIANYENIPKDWVFPSNGAAEAIFRIAFYLKPARGLVTAPSFSEYENSLRSVGATVDYYELLEETGFKINSHILNSINKDIDIVYICNPNNPTGQITEKGILEELVSYCKALGLVVVIDECFLDFVEDKDRYSTVNLLSKYDNLIILKAFTKIFAIPGMRLGYCCTSNENVIEGLKKSGPPWNVSNIAQAAGIAALGEKDYLNKTVAYVKEQRDYLRKELVNLNIKVYESYANYILFRIQDKLDLKDEFLKRGILIRSCSNYVNLDGSYYRIAVRNQEENKIFIKSLKDILGK